MVDMPERNFGGSRDTAVKALTDSRVGGMSE
jgi:hypothetical protein